MEDKRLNPDLEENRVLSGTQISGNIQTKQNICLDGKIQGRLESEKRIVINKNGMVQGDVICNELFLEGTISGDACVTHKTIMGTQALIEGKLVTESLEITPGASIKKGLKLQKPTTSKS